MNEDQLILTEFRKALQKSSGNDVVNLDEKITPRIHFTIQTFQEAMHQIGPYIAPNKWSYYRIGDTNK